MTKPRDRDTEGLERCCKAMGIISERMRKPILEFLWDKYVSSPIREKRKNR